MGERDDGKRASGARATPREALGFAGFVLCAPWAPCARFFMGRYELGLFEDPGAKDALFLFLLSFAALFAAALAVAVLARARSEAVVLRSCALLGIVLSAVGSVLLAACGVPTEPSTALGTLLCSCFGAAWGCLAGAWLREASWWPAGRRMRAAILAAVTAGVFLSPLSDAALDVAALACTVFSAAALVFASGSGLRSSGAGPCAERRRDPSGFSRDPGKEAPLFKQCVRRTTLRAFASLFLVGLAWTTMGCVFAFTAGRGTVAPLTWTTPFLGVATACVLLVVGWVRRREEDPYMALRLSCATAIPAFFPLSGESAYALQFAMAFAALSAFAVVPLAVVLVLTEEGDLRAVGSSGALRGVAGIGFGACAGLLFAYFAMARSPIGEEMVYFAGLIALLSAFLATNVLVVREPLETAKLVAAGRFPLRLDIADLMGKEDALSEACNRLALEKCLSEREAEVLTILARGNSLQRVQEKLFISEGTAATHRRHIYRKLDVHSKQELIDLVDSLMDGRLGERP
ncbi:helix-turn-helix transcriptional regulator [Gordonibacter sp. An230]|uniref:helix-turn-helix transcriptional regulator n=1 Tax=Gordonibacter sp. An230 TaxID=1965592 RepID=UPI0013A606EF|nr:LuxR C-terminal-related transcriptional regulator [Gordonibacter sp. An230]